MEIWDRYIPVYLTDKGNIIRTILFTALFALLFINIYAPFGVDTWFDVTRLELLFYSSIVILTGVLVVVLSRLLMYYFARTKKIRYWQYSIWIFLEIVCMASVYVMIEKLFIHDTRKFVDAFSISLQNTALIILLPYVVLWLYFSWRDKTQKLRRMIELNLQTEPGHKMIPFYDERNVLRFSIKSDDVYYLEAADNYVTIHYQGKDKIARFLVRTTLKRLEESLKNAPLVRCHRSYMINSDKVKIIRKEKDGFYLQLGLPDERSIPLSKTYSVSFLREFANVDDL